MHPRASPSELAALINPTFQSSRAQMFRPPHRCAHCPEREAHGLLSPRRAYSTEVGAPGNLPRPTFGIDLLGKYKALLSLRCFLCGVRRAISGGMRKLRTRQCSPVSVLTGEHWKKNCLLFHGAGLSVRKPAEWEALKRSIEIARCLTFHNITAGMFATVFH